MLAHPRKGIQVNLSRLSRRQKRTGLIALALVIIGLLASGCSMFGKGVDDLTSSLAGRAAVMTTFDENGNQIDEVKGKSFDIRRDETFDSKNPDGSTNEDSQVLSISVGGHLIHHVGSTLILADEGLNKVSDAPTQVDLQNSEDGTPWLNRLYRSFGNNWQGASRTIVIRSQNGFPIAVYAGNAVETFTADIPKTTWFRVDGKNLLVYRADYTVYDTALLG